MLATSCVKSTDYEEAILMVLQISYCLVQNVAHKILSSLYRLFIIY